MTCTTTVAVEPDVLLCAEQDAPQMDAPPPTSSTPRARPGEVSVPAALLASGMPVDAVRLWLLVRATAGADYVPTTALTRSGFGVALGCSDATVKRLQRRLVAAGWLGREHRRHGSTVHWTSYPEPKDLGW